ncbi:hypothetical protein VO178_15990 [Lysinibacillus fusiformis]|nr:hypothetical protein [Lysinibacillus fusiformis]WRS96863.1 hypothetical protein VO178_15990 [Lysinibacillus fusiformis]
MSIKKQCSGFAAQNKLVAPIADNNNVRNTYASCSGAVLGLV